MIIGLVGLKQVGKTTAADHLVEKHGFVKHNFKDALVTEIIQNFPKLLDEIMYEQYNQIVPIEQLFQEKPPLMRALMQNYGTEVRRGDDEDYWCSLWQNNLPEGHVVVDDVRFLNEAERIKEEDGILIRLTRPDVVASDQHSSEVEQESIQCDHEILCGPGDFEILYNNIDAIVKKH